MEITGYWLTKIILQRALALIYLIAFIAIVHQFKPLVGEKGILPVPQFIQHISFRNAPSIFQWLTSNVAFTIFGWLGVGLALFALLGFSERFGIGVSVITWSLLWILYLSFVNVGQRFFAFGWESMLLEAGFFAIFLGSVTTNPSFLVILLFRWLLFRTMFGAGLIKLRGDECWRNFTCLFYHYETQPIPNPLSWYFHWLPKWIHQFGVGFNHFVELIVPFFYFAPQPFAAIAGGLTLLFHGWLFISGNFSWLGLLTMVLAIPTFSGAQLRALFHFKPGLLSAPAPVFVYFIIVVTVITAFLSYYPIRNMLSRRQIMNTSYNPLHLVGTYGAFGSITRPRYEVIVEGTNEQTITPETTWHEYEFIGKPGDLKRTPPQIAPYHLRLDWLMWFLPFRATITSEGVSLPYGYDSWFINFMAKLLKNDKATLSLMRHNPFSDQPPHHIRALLYKYRFTTPYQKKKTGAIWDRELIGVYLPPISLDDPALRKILEAQGWHE
ncbi:lipase maturation factor family protein [Patescibacteria group bacterium AH-259-L07]|nr:lipase maturation factor family protein [Patescibacteria group bacterium AH-259-L07]